MQEIRECVICHKKFVATRWKMIVCTNEECRRVHTAEVKQAHSAMRNWQSLLNR